MLLFLPNDPKVVVDVCVDLNRPTLTTVPDFTVPDYTADRETLSLFR